MHKAFLALTVFICGSVFIPAQEKPVDRNPASPNDYSESMPYEPRIVTSSGSKTKKKSKKDSDEKKAEQSENELPASPVNGAKTIRIPVFVYDRNGKPVTDLQNSDIKVFIDEKETEIAAFDKSKAALNILLLLDTSPSTAYNDDDLKNVVSEMVKTLKPDDRLQIIKFNQELVVLTEPANNAEVFQKAIKKIKVGGGTSLYDAIRTINREYLSSNAEKPIIILLTDGVDTTSRKANYITSLVEAEKMGAVIFPFYFDSYEYFQKNKPRIPPIPLRVLSSPLLVGASKEEYEIGRAYLEDIAALSGGKAFALKNLSEIKKEDFEGAFKSINPQYYISITAADSASAFERKKIKIRVNRPNLIVRGRGSFILP
jgi:VWFA-related protein